MDILLVEDSDSIAETLTQLLRHFDHDVRRVACGADAVAAQSADLVLLDLGLPDIGGLEVLSRMRAAGSRTPIIIMTARREPGLRERALETGADAFIAKPFSFREFVEIINGVPTIHVAQPSNAAGVVPEILERGGERRGRRAAA